MRHQLLEYLRCPVSGEPFDLLPFETASAAGEEDVRFGILMSQESGHLYPILGGVPSLLPESFPREFLSRFAKEIADHLGPVPATLSRQANIKWSFSAEWEKFFDKDQETTWGWTTQERLEMLIQETQLSPDAFRGALVCDAGCGNGKLTEAITALGATVIGIDYSTSVFHAEQRRCSKNVHFVRGDLLAAPLAPGIFDVIISNGVLHHTRSTRDAFDKVANLVRPEGHFYLWLYRRSRDLKARLVRLRDNFVRPVCARLPRPLRDAAVHVDAGCMWVLTRLFGKRRRHTYKEILITSYDGLTPRYAWMHHTPTEVACWFFEKGFSAPALTHWDNPAGFGMVARKKPLADTPGLNYGRPNAFRRYYV
jgi:SAM-dependent methyltransferase/uncharacterized protein YbaR (Trm112 family)